LQALHDGAIESPIVIDLVVYASGKIVSVFVPVHIWAWCVITDFKVGVGRGPSYLKVIQDLHVVHSFRERLSKAVHWG